MSKGWIDAHTHLNDKSFIKDFDALMERIESADIRHINLVGVNIKDALRAFSLVDHYDIQCLHRFTPRRTQGLRA